MNGERYRAPLLEIERVLPILNRIAILGGLDDSQLYTVFRMLEVERFRSGDLVFEEGDSPGHIWIVLSGQVRIVQNLKENPLELFDFGPGACFGETSVIAVNPHTASAVAVADTELLVIPRQKLFGLYENDPKLFGLLILNIAREASRRLNQTQDVMLHYAMAGRPEK